MSYTRVSESRAYDFRYDPVYTGPFNDTHMANDPRVVAAASSQNAVAGTTRFKYFKRPMMPRMNAVPPYILLAPTATQDPLKPVEIVPEPAVKNAEVQTMYRESEAQTNPYTPDYFVADGVDPEVLLLKNLTYENGLPMGKKEMDMVIHARAKKEVECNLPPFTDEASLLLRKRLMEQQEMREFKLRENEIDAQREVRLQELQRVLYERDASNEFLQSQRIEATRQLRMEERERVLQKIRNKRIKVLRNLARQRNLADPLLTDGNKRDIINDYFDKASTVYAAVKREGRDLKTDLNKFDIASRTAPLDNITNIMNLEPCIPVELLQSEDPKPFSKAKALFSKSAPGVFSGGGRAAEERMTSAAQRALRNSKRDVEEMHQILVRKKRAAIMTRATERLDTTGTQLAATTPAGGERGMTTQSERDALQASGPVSSLLLSKKPKGRPVTPDLTTQAQSIVASGNADVAAASILLQRLLRGRAIQNIMYEGRFRRRELIAELRTADEFAIAQEAPKDTVMVEIERKNARERNLRSSSIDAVAGTLASSLLNTLAQEQLRNDNLTEMTKLAGEFMLERIKREAVEAGRRQKATAAPGGHAVPFPTHQNEEVPQEPHNQIHTNP